MFIKTNNNPHCIKPLFVHLLIFLFVTSFGSLVVYANPLPKAINWYVGNTEADEWIEYKKVWLSAGHYRFTASVSSKNANNKLHLKLNEIPLKNGVIVPQTNSVDAFELIHLGSKQLAEGYYDLKLFFETGGVSVDMFFVKKSADKSEKVLAGDVELLPPPMDDGPMLAPIAGTAKPGIKTVNYTDANENRYSKEQIESYFKFNVSYTESWQDAAEFFVQEALASRMEFIWAHGRSAIDLTNEIEDRDYKAGVGALSGLLLKGTIQALDRNPYADFLKFAYFCDNASFGLSYRQITKDQERPSHRDPKLHNFVWNHWFKPWYDTVPKHRRFRLEDGSLPIQLWTAQSGVTEKKESFLLYDFIAKKMKQEYGETIKYVFPRKIVELDPRNKAHLYGFQPWFIWSGRTHNFTDNNGTKIGFSLNGRKYPLKNMWLNDWDPKTNTGTNNPKVPIKAKDSDGYHVPATDANGVEDYRKNLEALSKEGVKWVQLESWGNMLEGSVWYKSDHPEYLFPNQFIGITREFSDRSTESLIFEAESSDFYFDKSAGNSGQAFRWNRHKVGTLDLDIYRPRRKLDTLQTPLQLGKPVKQITAGFSDVWILDEDGSVSSTELDGNDGWSGVETGNLTFSKLSLGRHRVWAIAGGRAYSAKLFKQSGDNQHTNWVKDEFLPRVQDIEVNEKQVWAISRSGSLYMTDVGAEGEWQKVASPEFIQLALSEYFVWGISTEGKLFNAPITMPEGNWKKVANPHQLVELDAGNGSVWGRNAEGNAYHIDEAGLSAWQFASGNVKTMAVGTGAAWLVLNQPENTIVHQKLIGFQNSNDPALQLAAPSGLALLLTDNKHRKLVWQDNSEGETVYEVERAFNSGPFKTVGKVKPKSAKLNAVMDSSPARGGKYSYRVRQFTEGVGYSNYSNVASISFRSKSDSNLALNKPVRTSSNKDSFVGSNAVDGNIKRDFSRWISDKRKKLPQWIEVDLQAMSQISYIKLFTGFNGYNKPINDFRFQYAKNGKWYDALNVTNNGKAEFAQTFGSVTTNRVRLYVTKSPGDYIRLYELEVYGRKVN